MEPTRDHPIRRFEDGAFRAERDAIIREERIELNVNDGELRIAMMVMPIELEALAVGFLKGEGALETRDDVGEISYDAEKRIIAIRGDFDADALEAVSARWTWGTACGGGGFSGGAGADEEHRVALPHAASERTVAARRLLDLAEEFNRRTDLWRRTGGVHACALSDGEALLAFAEDVGRHNAFDKVLGRAVLEGHDLTDKLMLTTGRLSAEIVSKAASAQVPLLISRSAVTSLAVRVAERCNLTLVGFCRGRRLNVYSAFHRVTEA